ncbi:hypothetical protein D9M71_737080 [compost metagenome]
MLRLSALLTSQRIPLNESLMLVIRRGSPLRFREKISVARINLLVRIFSLLNCAADSTVVKLKVVLSMGVSARAGKSHSVSFR